MRGRRAAIAAMLGGLVACRSSGATTAPAPAPSASATVNASAALDSGRTASAADANVAEASSPFPFGAPTAIAKFACPVVVAGGPFRAFLAAPDTRTAFVDGDDLLAIANRAPTGVLPPDYAPHDLVDVHDLSPRSVGECDGAHDCLRREAATALHTLLDAMKAAGMPGRIVSGFRAFRTQCWVFDGWAAKAKGGFCEAATQSALPGHSQHQLGTTVDLFTTDWMSKGEPFRDGFGCTPGGRWLDEHAWEYGFALPYPIDPDDRRDGSRCAARWDHAVPIDPKTGYKHEPWHLRYLGLDAAKQEHDAWTASGPGTPGEITLEQWLRARRGLPGDAELPVCDGCECGACATFAADGDKTPCGEASLQLDAAGHVAAPGDPPHLVDATVEPAKDGVTVVDVKVRSPAHTPTQPPVTTNQEPTYDATSTYASLVPYPATQAHRYDDLPGAWRVAIEPSPPLASRWPWRASLARADLETTYNRANLVLPAKAGEQTVQVRASLPPGTHSVRVTLWKDATEHETREIAVP